MELRPGSRVDRYVLREPLGEGGQGAVWKAEDPLDPSTPCAVKLVPVSIARPTDLERTRREARALARLSHPSLVTANAMFEDLKLGVLGIAMDLVDGDSLRKLLTDPRFDVEHRDSVLIHVARALAYLHDQGIVHRDVKLDNVLVKNAFWTDPTNADTVKLVDLGIASVRGSAEQLTALGTVMGTIPYLSPELIDPATFDGDTSAPTVDVFAFGVMAYQLVVGRHPSGLPPNSKIADYARVYRQASEGDRPFPDSQPEGGLGDMLREALALRPRERIKNGSELLARIEGHSSVVIRPPPVSREEIGQAPTSIASPSAMRDPTVALGPAVVKPVSEPKKKLGSGIWIAAVTLFAALVGGVVLAQKLGEPSSSLAVVPSAASAAPKSRRAPPAADAATPDGGAEASAAVADECADAAICTCCPSGRGCGAGGCDAPLDPENNWTLRVGAVDRENDAGSLFATHAAAVVCLSRAGDNGVLTCTRLSETVDGGTTPGLNVNYADLVGAGIDVLVGVPLMEPPSRDTISTLGEQKAVKFQDLKRRALCSGLGVTFDTDHRQIPDLARVVLWLDDPDDAKPKRCP